MFNDRERNFIYSYNWIEFANRDKPYTEKFSAYGKNLSHNWNLSSLTKDEMKYVINLFKEYKNFISNAYEKSGDIIIEFNGRKTKGGYVLIDRYENKIKQTDYHIVDIIQQVQRKVGPIGILFTDIVQPNQIGVSYSDMYTTDLKYIGKTTVIPRIYDSKKYTISVAKAPSRNYSGNIMDYMSDY